MLDQTTDAYRRFLAGDSTQFDTVLDACREPLIFYINRYVHNLHDAEDLAMDTFADLLARPGRYRFDSSIKTYLFSIGAHKAIDFIRKHKRLHVCDTDTLSCLSSEEESLSEAVIRDERRRALLSAIDRLPENYRNAVYLVYFEEMSYADAGKILKKSEKQINNLCYRAKGNLRKYLQEGGFGHEDS